SFHAILQAQLGMAGIIRRNGAGLLLLGTEGLAPALGESRTARGRGGRLGVGAVDVGVEDARDRPLREGTLAKDHGIAARHATLAEHAEVPASAHALHDAGGQVGKVPLARELPARQAGLADLDERLADLVGVADADGALVQARDREVLTEGAGLHVEPELLAPSRIWLRPVSEHGLVRPAVDLK